MIDLLRVELWDAINLYAESCGGSPQSVGIASKRRELDVAGIEEAVHRIAQQTSAIEKAARLAKFAIWWTAHEDCEAISYNLAEGWDVPSYLASEYRSRFGRAGRARLWIAAELTREGCPNEAKFPLPLTPLAAVIERRSMAGIVIRASDLGCLEELPGFVTDFECGRFVE